MAEFFSDQNTEIERVFLWQTVEDAFRNNADLLGIQSAFCLVEEDEFSLTRLVLADEPNADEDTLQLWAEVSRVALIAKVSIIYSDVNGKETYNYEITPDSITQYSSYPSPLDACDLHDLRTDVSETVWNKQRSKTCAKNLLFFS